MEDSWTPFHFLHWWLALTRPRISMVRLTLCALFWDLLLNEGQLVHRTTRSGWTSCLNSMSFSPLMAWLDPGLPLLINHLLYIFVCALRLILLNADNSSGRTSLLKPPFPLVGQLVHGTSVHTCFYLIDMHVIIGPLSKSFASYLWRLRVCSVMFLHGSSNAIPGDFETLGGSRLKFP